MLSSSENSPALGAVSFLLSIIGLPIGLWGLRLTYVQAKNAVLTTEQLKREINAFDFRKQQYDAFSDASEARKAMEAAGKLIKLGSWQDAAVSYDDARRSILSIKLSCKHLPKRMQASLNAITDHLHVFGEHVDAATAGKGAFPDQTKVLAAIRRNCDTLTEIQVEIQRRMQ